MGKETSQLTEKEALTIYARMMHSLDSSEFESFLAEDFSYSSQKVLTDMNSKDEFIEYIRPKLEVIKKTNSPVYAELGVCPAYGHNDCLIMAQGDKSNLLGVAYASVDEGKITGLSLCIVPTADSAIRSGIYPGLNEVDPDLNEMDPGFNVKKDQVIITEEEFQRKEEESQRKLQQLLNLGKKETYQIGLSGYDEVQAFGMAFGLMGERERPKEDFCESTNFNNLESSLPSDTIKVATYLHKKYSTKKIFFYVCSFTESTQRANHQEVYSLFSIMWSIDSLWELNPWYCCSVLSEEPQAPLHKEAANWMFKGVATTGCLIASVDDFKKGTLEILI